MDLIVKEFLRIGLRHDYFKEGLSPYFSIQPTQATALKMKNFHIFRKLLTNEFSLSVGLRKEELQIVDELRGFGKLHFLLLNQHEYLVNYTNLRLLDRMVEILYLSTSAEGHQIQQTNPVGNNHVLQLRPLRFNVELNEPGHVQIKSSDQTVLFDVDLASQGINILPVNLSAIGDGYYELWINDQFEEKFFATNVDFPKGCIGVIELDSKDVCAELEKEEGAIHFDIEFETKSCFWEYEIALSDQKKIDIHKISIDGKEQLAFHEARNEQMAGRVELTVFTSKDSKKLLGQLDEHMELVVEYSNQHSERKAEMIVKLPVPDIKRVHTRIDENGNEMMVAPTLVYI